MENKVAVLKGDLDWMSELRAVLMDSGIPGAVQSDADRRKGCGTACQLVVSPDDLERAQKRIEEYLMEISPELLISQELLGQNKCPVCGSVFDSDAKECPDCGMPLIIGEH